MEPVYEEENNMSYFNIYLTLEILFDWNEYYSIVFQIKKPPQSTIPNSLYYAIFLILGGSQR